MPAGGWGVPWRHARHGLAVGDKSRSCQEDRAYRSIKHCNFRDHALWESDAQARGQLCLGLIGTILVVSRLCMQTDSLPALSYSGLRATNLLILPCDDASKSMANLLLHLSASISWIQAWLPCRSSLCLLRRLRPICLSFRCRSL